MLKRKEKDKKSHLKDRPLRNAGQSLDQEIGLLIGEDLVSYLICAWFLIVVSLVERLRCYKSYPLSLSYSLAFTLVSLIIVYDGSKITANGFELDRNSVEQVRACASWLRNILMVAKLPLDKLIGRYIA